MRDMRVGAAILAEWALLLVVGNVFAQEGPADAKANAPAASPSTGLPNLPPPAPDVEAMPPTAARGLPEAASADHDLFVKHLAVGYFGVTSLPIAASGMAGAAPQRGTVAAPVVGVRYWLRRNVGIDAGVGIGILTGSQDIMQSGSSSSSGNGPSSFGFAVHAGMPIALAYATHYVFELVPEALVGFTTGSIKTPGMSDQTVNGFRLDFGGRAGAEIHFGFIGVPQLALQASIGLFFRRTTYGWSQDNNSGSISSNSLTTSVQTEPWAIFVDNISALYYF